MTRRRSAGPVARLEERRAPSREELGWALAGLLPIAARVLSAGGGLRVIDEEWVRRQTDGPGGPRHTTGERR